MLVRPLCVLCLVWIALPAAFGQIASTKLNIYVAQFATDPSIRTDLVQDLERTVESILVSSDDYNVLERSEASRLRSELRNEADVVENKDVRASLTKLKADGVLFGRLHHDVNSGEYIFYLKLVRLDSTIMWARDGELPQGTIDNYQSRKNLLAELVDGSHASRTQPVHSGAVLQSPLSKGGFFGTWSGTYACQSINPLLRTGRLDWRVTKVDGSDGKVKIHEIFSRGFTATVDYTALITGNSILATPQTGDRYQIKATLSPDGDTISGNYEDHPKCQTMTLHRVNQ